jgi:hypothetical protein
VFSDTCLAVAVAAYEPQCTLAGTQYSCSDQTYGMGSVLTDCHLSVSAVFGMSHAAQSNCKTLLHSCSVKHLHVSTTAVAADVHRRFSFCLMAFHGISIARNELRDHGPSQPS